MSKRGAEEIAKPEEAATEEAAVVAVVKPAEEEAHPYAFHVSGPRNLSSPNWRELINSSWKDPNYKRTVIACFIQAVYLLELDRQENRREDTALAPKWWIPFKYKLTETLVDERDGSVFGAVLEWDRSAAIADLIVIRPNGAPRAVLALRGTILKSATIRRDVEDDLRFFAWESLKGSVRFRTALESLKSAAQRYGSSNVCIAGHSLGAGFALQVGKALAKEGLFVDAHLFNPPSISLAMSLRNVGEKAGSAWKRLRAMLPSSSENQGAAATGAEAGKANSSTQGFRNWLPNFYGEKTPVGLKKWVPHLYVNNSDYICCHYTDPHVVEDSNANKENMGSTSGGVGAKLFVMSKGKQKFLEAHGLEQWWSDNLELQSAIHSSRLISQQLKSLYSAPAQQQTQGKQ